MVQFLSFKSINLIQICYHKLASKQLNIEVFSTIYHYLIFMYTYRQKSELDILIQYKVILLMY
jgi:hypothetical protein